MHLIFLYFSNEYTREKGIGGRIHNGRFQRSMARIIVREERSGRFDLLGDAGMCIDMNKGKEICAMKKKNNNNNQSLDLITTVDVLNTLSGGVSEPQQNFSESEVGRVLRIRIPGIQKGSMNVEIHNNHLTIFYYINIASYDKLVQVPQVIYNKAVPYYIDISKIHATFEVDELVVHMPFNRLSNGYHRKVRINEN